MWTKVWLLLGRSALLPEPGDYQVEEVGPESIIMSRQTDGSVRSFFNVCQHRGSRLTFAAEGTAKQFTCPYHGWRYDNDGTLVHLQDAEDFPGNPCEELRLAELRTEEFAGFSVGQHGPRCLHVGRIPGPALRRMVRVSGLKNGPALPR